MNLPPTGGVPAKSHALENRFLFQKDVPCPVISPKFVKEISVMSCGKYNELLSAKIQAKATKLFFKILIRFFPTNDPIVGIISDSLMPCFTKSAIILSAGIGPSLVWSLT